MSGHSKWAGIKHKKAVVDARRGKLFAKLIRGIEVAAREGGGSNPANNMTLAAAVDRAKQSRVPAETIERAAKRGAGELGDDVKYERVMYEGYAPGGVAVLIETLTDNRNRTGGDIRTALTRAGGNLGEPGSVAWMFDRKGQIYIDAGRQDEDATLEAALDAGAEDLTREGDQYLVTTTPAAFHAVQDALKARQLAIDSAELTMVPRNTVKVEGVDAERILKLMEALEELDDVSKVSSNFDIDAAQLAEAEA